MNSIQSSSYKASLRSKIAVAAAKAIPGDSMDAIKERMTFTRKMYRMILEEKNIDLFWFFTLSNINPFLIMLLNGNQIYTLMCETKRHDMMVASDNYEEVMSEAMVLCKAVNEEVRIFCHGTGYVQGNITPKFLKSIAWLT